MDKKNTNLFKNSANLLRQDPRNNRWNSNFQNEILKSFNFENKDKFWHVVNRTNPGKDKIIPQYKKFKWSPSKNINDFDNAAFKNQ